jgi:hypothetical protein
MQAQGGSVWPNQPVYYIEDVFSTYLYTGNASGGVGTIDVVNNIDLSTKGGLVWIKPRSGTGGTDPHAWYDTVRGARYGISSNLTDAQDYASVAGRELYQFNTTGFSVGPAQTYNVNSLNVPFVSWTFRKQPKFFDVVTYTGTGSNTTIAHSLGVVPGCIMVKRTDTTGDWQVYHRSNANTQYMVLNTTASVATGATRWNSTTPTSTVFSLGTDATVNASGGTYVAYIYAHDAGGFGLTGTDNVISCGSFTTTTSPDFINLGYEPQWVLIKSASSATNWYIFDNMRGIPTGGLDSRLNPNLGAAEQTDADYLNLNATGFTSNFQSIFGDGINLIYIAIRRGPMKVPTLGTSVYNAIARTGTGATANVTGVGFTTDLIFAKQRTSNFWEWIDRLRGADINLFSNSTDAEYSNATTSYKSLTSFALMDGVTLGADQWNGYINYSPNTYINYFLRRAPSFFDEVCYTGTNSITTQSHNLGSVPELMIVKARSSASYNWTVYVSSLGNGSILRLNLTNAVVNTSDAWNNTTPTSTQFSLGNNNTVNESGTTYVAYLFATCAGVSKVGSYTGNATLTTIDCGFTGGARFVLIKCTSQAGNWYVWDTARGMVAGTDPSLSLNTTAAEANYNNVYTITTGFQILAAPAFGINDSGQTYIFLAIA